MKNHPRLRVAVSLAICMGAVAPSSAQDAAKLLAKQAEYQGATLSPTGEYVAVTTPFEDRRALSLIKLSGNYDRNVIKFDIGPDPSGDIVIPQPINPTWTDDNRIMVTKARDYGRFGSLVTTGDVYASNADGTEQSQLWGYQPDRGNVRSRFKDGGRSYLIDVLDGTNGEALFYFMPWTRGNSTYVTSVYRVDTHRGLRTIVERFDDDVNVAADNDGKLRVKSVVDLQEVQHVQFRVQPDSAWTDAPRSLVGKSFSPWWFDADNRKLYAQISDAGEPASLYLVDITNATREKLTSHPTLEISGIERAGRRGPPVVLTYTAGKPKVDYLDPKSDWVKLHAGLMKAFPGQMVTFQDVTKDEKKVLLYVYGDRHPGAYYIFDRTTNRPALLFETRPWIDPAKMSPMTSIEFKNRGGETLYGFLTTPLGRAGPQPLVVMPHGGPFGVSDYWRFDNDVQFLASLGYAVLQVNYRGSGGRGDNFMDATERQWATGIQDDIADGVKHVISQNLADSKRVCIYGASFGGYSAMMNPIRNPGMYKCAIGYAGVYDLVKLESDGDASKQGRAFFERSVGKDKSELAMHSPTTLVAKLDVPMLLIHGKSDYRAPLSQFNAAVAALSHAGKTYETLVKPNEGHGFYKEANRVEAYERMRSFLLKYNPPN